MERKFINRLAKDELMSELDYRGVGNLESLSIDKLRKMLRKFLKLEDEGVTFSPKKSSDVKVDLTVLSGKVETISKSIEGFNEGELKKFAPKGEAKLTHIHGRLSALMKEQCDADTSTELKQLLEKTEGILGVMKLSSAARVVNPNLLKPAGSQAEESETELSDSSRYDEQDTTNPTDLSSESSDELHRKRLAAKAKADKRGSGKKRNHSSRAKNTRRALSLSGTGSESDDGIFDRNRGTTYFKRTPVSNWNLKFSAEDTNSMSIRRFFIEVRDFRIANRMSKNELLREAKFLFQGSALEVFRSCRRSFRTWDELEERITLAFTDPSYEKRLKREIQDRKQGEDEPVVVYLSKMDNLFHLLSQPYSEKEKLEIIEDNILPEYQMALSLATYRNLKDLEKLLIKLEASRARASLSKTSVGKGSVEPSLQHVSQGSKGKSRTENQVCTVEATPPSKSPETPAPTRALKKKVYCYGCKKPGVTRPNCPDCSPKAGNGKAGTDRLGVLPETKPKAESQSMSA